MPIPKEEVFHVAVEAVKKMLELYGPDYRFPADVIWQHIQPGVDVNPLHKSHQARKLIEEGYLRLTGSQTKAQSKQRAGSITNEYRFGPELVPYSDESAQATVPPTHSNGNGQPTAAPSISPSESLKGMQAHMDAEGYVLTVAELANFFLALTVSPLVILSGISGTGKSLLPRKFAKLTHSSFHPIPVQPQWSDNSDLFGYVPTLAPTKYVKGSLIDGLLEAKRNPEKLVLAALDEMNLAPVEHYFSDFLSVAETRRREDGKITSDTLPIELPDATPATTADESELTGIRLPSNLRVVGTANMDETTHTFSPKVLDRAFTIELDDPELTTFASGTDVPGSITFEKLARIVIEQSNAITVHEARAQSQDLFEHVAQLLSEIQDILSPAGIKFGYRTRDAILLYLHFWKELHLSDIMTGYAALDFCILQKILPKISGSGELLAVALKQLSSWLNEQAKPQEGADALTQVFIGPLARSQHKVDRMAEILELDGATRFWGA